MYGLSWTAGGGIRRGPRRCPCGSTSHIPQRGRGPGSKACVAAGSSNGPGLSRSGSTPRPGGHKARSSSAGAASTSVPCVSPDVCGVCLAASTTPFPVELSLIRGATVVHPVVVAGPGSARPHSATTARFAPGCSRTVSITGRTSVCWRTGIKVALAIKVRSTCRSWYARAPLQPSTSVRKRKRARRTRGCRAGSLSMS